MKVDTGTTDEGGIVLRYERPRGTVTLTAEEARELVSNMTACLHEIDERTALEDLRKNAIHLDTLVTEIGASPSQAAWALYERAKEIGVKAAKEEKRGSSD